MESRVGNHTAQGFFININETQDTLPLPFSSTLVLLAYFPVDRHCYNNATLAPCKNTDCSCAVSYFHINFCNSIFGMQGKMKSRNTVIQWNQCQFEQNHLLFVKKISFWPRHTDVTKVI